MASSSSSTGSDLDEAFDEDMEALRRACMLTGADPVAVDDSGSDSCGESSDTDDVDLLRRLQERFYDPSSDADSLPLIKPLISLPPPDSDEEDDFETLRAIQKRFTQYESDAAGRKSQNFIQDTEIVVADMTYGQETRNILPNNGKNMAPSEELLASGFTERAEDEASNVNFRGFMKYQFPKSAKFFVDALKKNRSCQKFIRRKLIEIEAKIEENKELKERLKCLMDFQVACKRKAGRILSQKKDPRVRLISMQKPRTIKDSKASYKKVPALFFGPAENSHVSKYKMVLKTFPFSLRKQKWSNMEKEKLAKGIKQQYQEMLILSSMNCESDIDSNLMSALSSSDLDITPEKIRSFLPLVNWDRLASMYITGHFGAECEARWLNCEDPMVNHNPWTILEDKKLLFIVQESGVYNWIDISIALGSNRTPFQCLARYQRSLNPHILNKDWTEDEDAKLRAAVESFGDNNWQLVASNLEGRTGPQCSNRWRKSLNPDRRKVGRWSVDEDKHLKVAVMLFGAKNWNKIAQFAPGRTQVQCRERWLNCLDPSLNLKAWTEEEDAKLLAAIAEHGYCWSKVATCVPPRTDSQCRRRWKVLLPHEVPLLQAARKMKRTVLISNFVDRESERPTIGPNDFTPLVNFSEAENDDGTRPRKKRSSDNQPKKSRVKSKRSFNETSTADGVINISTNAVPADSALVCGINSNTAGGGSSKRSRKKKSSDDQPKKLRATSSRSVKEHVTADGMVNSSADKVPSDKSLVHIVSTTTAESGRIKRTRKKMLSGDQRNNSMVKSRESCKKNIMADGMVNSSTETAPADLSLVPSANSNTAENGSIKRTGKRTSSDNQPNQSRVKSRRFVKLNLETDAMVNSTGDIVPAGLSAVPNVNFSTAECGGNKRTAQRTLSCNQHNKSKAKSRRFHEENRTTVDTVIDSYADTIPADASLVPIVNSNNAESGNIKRTRKKTLRGPEAEAQKVASYDGPLLMLSKKSSAERDVRQKIK
ncbi:uncharacterized protein LOC103709816 isoform X1 [Phoenix dactylifera]|uniref:Uncharacterized protein LOC103709816 isoform X1 n=2 Tax=Phoenix dactylifera TaxID=42345 RepID=A0A8B8J677_PHODC|nr:uncharacterized protein LOC103709816 isoform X1 [Phoenix dactylifera]XP_026661510.2 uncharacterized protein LOC103709816 isoform X1 [Phoenix dactylifera]XP_026661511.2 uncharacterized protein LOC103709816 isoform X1 [Phoenix dactylifera]XP_026661512.2 uncharacterized protein LOC103709816 isoform X1 [Phoenix dactylifera]